MEGEPGSRAALLGAAGQEVLAQGHTMWPGCAGPCWPACQRPLGSWGTFLRGRVSPPPVLLPSGEAMILE